MKYPVTDAQLLSLCNYLKSTTYIYYPGQIQFLQDLYNTGCRPKEIINTSLWTYNNDSDIRLQPLKGNNTRYFISTDLSFSLYWAIYFQIKPYEGLTLRQLNCVTKKILPVSVIYGKNKSAIDYMFRYNYVRQLAASGMSDADIAIKMGWSSATLASSYRTAAIYSSAPLP
jgi:hypothetical protein